MSEQKKQTDIIGKNDKNRGTAFTIKTNKRDVLVQNNVICIKTTEKGI